MKTRYGKGKRRRKTVRQAERKARRKALHREVRGALQLAFDEEEVLALLQGSLDTVAIELGRQVVIQFLERDVDELCGPWYQRQPERSATRYGHQSGFACIGGQKVSLSRPRVRSTRPDEGEVPLPIYEKLQQPDALPQAFLRRMVRGVSCRDYEGVMDLAAESFGVKKSSVSRGFVRASAAGLREWSCRRYADVRFVAVFIDGIQYAGETLVVALGLAADGTKYVLGLRQGATENAEVVKSLLEELVERGLNPSRPTLFVLDGAKALVAAVKRVFGRFAEVQRCQIHKKANVKAHLAEKHHAELERRLGEAYGETSYSKALSQLEGSVRWLNKISPDAASSLEEGLAETLTVIRLGVPQPLRRTLSSTNVIESALSVTRYVTARVKRWRDGDMRARWCAAGLCRAQEKFRRVKGYRQIPQLLAALDATQLDAKPRAG
jgi:putative transposase